MDAQSRKIIAGFLLVSLLWVGGLSYFVLSGPPPPADNTIEHDVGLSLPTVEAHDFWFRKQNLTDLFITIADAIANYTFPDVVFEETVEWGVVYGSTGDWFNHSLPGEPTVVLLQMHPTNHTIHGGLLVFPAVYDFSATQWQLGLYYYNGTQINEDLLVMYHLRWNPGPD